MHVTTTSLELTETIVCDYIIKINMKSNCWKMFLILATTSDKTEPNERWNQFKIINMSIMYYINVKSFIQITYTQKTNKAKYILTISNWMKNKQSLTYDKSKKIFIITTQKKKNENLNKVIIIEYNEIKLNNYF